MEYFNIAKPYILPVIFILAGLISSRIFNSFVAVKLQKLANLTSWGGDDIFLKNIKKYISFWLIIGGFYLAFETGVFPISITYPASKIFLVLFVISAAFAISNIIGTAVASYTGKYNTEFHNLGILMIILRSLIIGIAVLMLLQTFGMKITPLLGALGVGSMAAGFALKDTLANFFAGIQILMSKQLHVGNFIQLSSGMEGTITDITLRNTTLIDRSNNTIVVPNAELAIATIVNYSIPTPNLRVKVDCGVAYDSDLDRVEELVISTAKEIMHNVKGAIPDFEPRMRFHTFGESSIDFTVVMRAANFSAQHLVRSEFVKLLKKRFDENNIEIPFPIRTIKRDE